MGVTRAPQPDRRLGKVKARSFYPSVMGIRLAQGPDESKACGLSGVNFASDPHHWQGRFYRNTGCAYSCFCGTCARQCSMARYKQRQDGEGFTVPCAEVYRIACCDCGLVHDFVFVSDDGKPIGIAARRNNRATAQRRKRTTMNSEASQNGTARSSMPRRKYETLKRRHDFLRALPTGQQNNFVEAEVSALDWVLYRHEPNKSSANLAGEPSPA